MMAERMLDRYGVADLLGVSAETAYNLMRQMRRIPVTKTGASQRPKYMVTPSEVTRWQQEMMEADCAKKAQPVRKREVSIAYDPELFEPDGRIKRRRPAK